VDWGGTNGRVVAMQLARGDVRVLAQEAFAFAESDKTGPAARLFDEIAATVDRVVAGGSGGADGPVPLGLVYSFPARHERIDRAIALSLTKGWRVAGLVGQDVACLMRAALARRGLHEVRLAAVVNDTVAALALASYRARGADR